MSETHETSWLDWIGADVVDATGTKLGTLTSVYMDRASGEPEWFAVKTGLLGGRSTFVPIEGTEVAGDALRVPHTKEAITGAPDVDDDGRLTPEEEARLYQHYGRQGYEDWGEPSDLDAPDGDTAMTRSEEELEIGVRQREAGRLRLHKYVVTQHVTTTVPVRKERVRIEREPITEADLDPAAGGSALSEEEHEIVLHEEVAVVTKRVVPKERVRLEKEVVVVEEEVGDDVRKEQIELEGDGDVAR